MTRLRAGLGYLVILLLAFSIAPSLGAQTAAPAKSALVVLSNTACTLSVDGEKAADLRADEPLRLEVAAGDYVVSAVAADGRRWSRVLRVEGAKRIVQIDFAAPAASTPAPEVIAAPAPAAAPAQVPVPVAAPAAARAPASPPPGSPGLSWVLVPAGEFEMGCSQGDTECNAAEMPRRIVRVEKPFEMMDKPVTVAQFRDWASSSQRKLPAQPKWSADDVPVVNATWDEAVAFCSAFVGRLPTEIEWEYAARAGSPAARYGELDAIAWYAGNSDKRAHPVGRKAPNAFGLYDMLGNVWEWNADVYRGAPAEGDAVQAGPGDARSLRGGSWRNKARQIRVSNRGRLAPDDREDDDGLRCVRDATPR
jgi:formylglycine-generating enzyme required for sulfatase activity